jgi:hypothetical protein
MKRSTQIKFFFDRWVAPSYRLFCYSGNNICKEFSNVSLHNGHLRTFNYGEM